LKAPLILDNLSFRILDLEKRKDLIGKKFINENGTYILDEYNCLVKSGKTHPKLKRLLKKINKES